VNHPLFGLVGIAVILILAALLSNKKREIRWRVILSCLAIQALIAFIALYTSWGKSGLSGLSFGFQSLLDYAGKGITFIFGHLVPDFSKGEFSFLVIVLPVIVFFGALMEILYHFKIMQFIVKIFGRGLRVLTNTRPVESFNAVANIFVGQTEAPLSLKPYLGSISRAELFTIMVSGMASIAGSVLLAIIGFGISPEYLIAACFMSAPAGLMMAKIIMPDEAPTKEEARQALSDENEPKHTNVIMAATVGTQSGLNMAVNVGAMVFVFIALIALVNGFLSWIGSLVGIDGLSLQMILGYIFAPIMYVLNVASWEEAKLAGSIFGEKIITNEIVAFSSLKENLAGLSEQTKAVLTFALCGFANLSSIGILMGGLGSLIPDRKPEIAELGIKALLAATLANLMNAALAGIMVGFGGGFA